MIKIGIIGGTGYTGVELLRLLAAHPQADLRVITSRGEAGKKVAALFSNLRGDVDLAFSEPDPKTLAGCDVVFSATPNGVAMTHARELMKAGVKFIDLAADFRIQDLDAERPGPFPLVRVGIGGADPVRWVAVGDEAADEAPGHVAAADKTDAFVLHALPLSGWFVSNSLPEPAVMSKS